MKQQQIAGIHHITAMAGDPQANLDFYTGVLGLRLVKLTINYDDPGTYHFYYGDGVGNPGTILTFFPWPKANRGRHGTGQVTVSSFAISPGSVDFWQRRLKENGIPFDGPFDRFGDPVLSFSDIDGLRLELVASDRSNPERAWVDGPVPAEHAIRGIHGATLSQQGHERTGKLLTETMGFRLASEDGNRYRYVTAAGGPGSIVDVVATPGTPYGLVSVGTVHHIAWRTPTDEEEAVWRGTLTGLGYNVSPVMDRTYFNSIYFREPGGVLFEIATDKPGFAVDEPAESLGSKLILPRWLEPSREEIERALPAIELAGQAK